MGAIIKACLVGNSLRNTGKECDASMVATAMLIAVPRTLKITLEDLADPVAWITPLLHASKADRVYPFFGTVAPINTINNNAEADILVTLDDGTQVFLRYGVYNRLFSTISGGLCYAKALQGLNKSGYNIIEIDQQGQMLLHKNDDGTFSGLTTTFMYSPAPVMADFKTTPYTNRFQMSYTPIELVQFGEVFTGAAPLLSLMGLIDSEVTLGAAPTVTSAATAATADVALTVQGAVGTKINVKVNGVTISGDVERTSAETTVTLMADKIATAITNLAGTNGGYTAENAAGVFTITAPKQLGATINAVTATFVTTGSWTLDPDPFAGGVTGVGVLNVGVQTECAEADLVALLGSKLGTHVNNFVVTNTATSLVLVPSSAAIVSGYVALTGNFLDGETYTVIGSSPASWYGNAIEGYDASENGVDILVAA